MVVRHRESCEPRLNPPFSLPPPSPSLPQVIECDIAPQVASRGVGIAPYKGKHAQVGGCGGVACVGAVSFVVRSSAAPQVDLHLACLPTAFCLPPCNAFGLQGSGGENAAAIYRLAAEQGARGGEGPSGSGLMSAGAARAGVAGDWAVQEEACSFLFFRRPGFIVARQTISQQTRLSSTHPTKQT